MTCTPLRVDKHLMIWNILKTEDLDPHRQKLRDAIDADRKVRFSLIIPSTKMRMKLKLVTYFLWEAKYVKWHSHSLMFSLLLILYTIVLSMQLSHGYTIDLSRTQFTTRIIFYTNLRDQMRRRICLQLRKPFCHLHTKQRWNAKGTRTMKNSLMFGF
mgnify:CR=1 FL=1